MSASESSTSSTDSVHATEEGTQSTRFLRDVAVEDVRELDVRHFAAAENARDRLADRAESEQRHARPLGRTGRLSMSCQTLHLRLASDGSQRVPLATLRAAHTDQEAITLQTP